MTTPDAEGSSSPTPGPPAACPPDETLLAVAGGMPLAPALAKHLSSCARCRGTLETLGSDDRFTRRFASAMRSDSGARQTHDQGPPEVPGYTIEGELARGGQGVVYRAVQHETNRPVALKAILRGVLASQREIARFEREVEIAASLRHPNIVTVFEARLLPDGRHVLAMDLVEGVPLSTWAAAAPRSVAGLRTRLELIRDAARAVQYAHNKGVIHRDLKPANILVEGSTPSPKILDFGLARRGPAPDPAKPSLGSQPARRESTLFGGLTVMGVFQGTPAYASPEQFDGEPARIDVRTDVYALGVMLHELLTGQVPFADSKDNITQIASSKRTKLLPKPSALAKAAGNAALPGIGPDIDAVVARATAPSREQRYPTAAAFADDLDALLIGEAVSARTGRVYTTRKFLRRHRVASLALLGISAGLATFGAVLISHNRSLTAALKLEAIGRARALARSGDRLQAEQILWSPILAEPSTRSFLDEAIHREPERRRLLWAMMEIFSSRPCVGITRAETRLCQWRHDRDSSTFMGQDGYAREFSFPSLALNSSRRICDPLPMHSITIEGDTLAWQDGKSFYQVDLVSGNLACSFDLPNLGHVVHDVSQNPFLVRPVDDMIQFHHVPDLALIASIPKRKPQSTFCFDSKGDGVHFLTAQGQVRYQRFGAEPAPSESSPWNAVFGRAFAGRSTPDAVRLQESPLGNFLAVVVDRTLFVLDRHGNHRRFSSILSGQNVQAIFSPDEHWIAVNANGDSDLALIDLRTKERLANVSGQDGLIRYCDFSPDSRYLITQDSKNHLRVWPLEGGDWRRPIRGTPRPHRASFGIDDSILLALTDGRVVRCRATSSETAETWNTELRPARVAIEALSGTPRLYVAGEGPDILLYEGADHESPARRLTVPSPTGSTTHGETPPAVFTMVLSPDGSLLAAGTQGGHVRLWHTGDWSIAAERHFASDRIRSLRWIKETPKSRPLLIASVDANNVLLLDPSDLSTLKTFSHEMQVRSAVPSPDGTILATLGDERIVRLWRLPGGELISARARVAADLFAASFHPSGLLLAVSDRSGVVSIIGTDSGEILASFPSPGPVTTVAFTPDGHSLVVGGGEGDTEIWDFASLAGFVERCRDFWRDNPPPTPR